MTFLAPGFLLAAGLAALGVVGLHFLSTRDPRLESFPTVRFVPESAVRARALAARFTDARLLLLRVLMLLLVGAALARPVLTPPRRPVARIVAVDVSRAVGRPAELVDSANAYLTDAAAVILFDAAAREVSAGAADSLAAFASASRDPAAPRGSLSAALVAARRAAARLRDAADSLELVLISPFAREERDAATAALRTLWPGRIETVRVAAASVPDSAAARVEWADSSATPLWTARLVPDTVGAVRVGGTVLVHRFARHWRPATSPGATIRVAGRWPDGAPAVLERLDADGCIRSFGFALPAEGDVLLRPAFQRFLDDLAAPCGAPRDYAPLGTEFLEALRGSGPLAAASAIAPPIERATALAPWLLAAAMLLALLELLVRRPVRAGTSATRAGSRAGASQAGASPADASPADASAEEDTRRAVPADTGRRRSV